MSLAVATPSAALARRVLFVVFTLSGFAGLIYESIWSHYLKLMLGHAAHAQTLVLVLFMGGMALGAWMCGRVSERLRNPLLAYAAVELVLGLFALGFDPVFRSISGWLLNSAAPALGQPVAIELLKWSLAALLILPACVLLGATFPLISAGVLRLEPSSAGNALGWLYFTNSLGAVAGVLTSGFVLIGWVGLPGTLLTAGLCNFLLALSVWALAKQVDTPPVPRAAVVAATGTADAAIPPVHLLLLTAFLTGAASFMYEIGWIRMLSLVLGSATHSFELMLGAFILGLALGALYIRNRVDRVREPLRVLAWVQVLMAVAALGTLVVYGWSFEWMAAIVQTLAKTDTGYLWFNLLSQAICMALMLPVTFFAGMTLPIITALALRTASGEAAIGKVYSANTWGAIVGVVVAVNLAMPFLGLRNVVIVGAGIDLLLGLWLFSKAGMPVSLPARALLAGAVAAGVAVAVFVRFDPSVLASGVFRNGSLTNLQESVWRRDGRTASIDVSLHRQPGIISIKTNGKPDAALIQNGTSLDDFTMILTGALPLALKPDAQQVAVIGFGSGRSTHVFLGSPHVTSVDTIEIEPAMVEGARLFGALVERAYTDPRSHIHIEDAKTFFARYQKQYDIIMSEPSNPWVSGVASLFSREFYHQVKAYLAPGGVFVQWLQMYEFDDSLFASVTRALGEEFEDYVIYAADDTNVLIAAVPRGKVPAPDISIAKVDGIRDLAASIGVQRIEDLHIRRLGGRAAVEPFMRSFRSPENSDYFPYLDQNAARFRFLQSAAFGLSQAHPVIHRIEGLAISYANVSETSEISAAVMSRHAQIFRRYLAWRYGKASEGEKVAEKLPRVMERASGLGSILQHCDPTQVGVLWMHYLVNVGDLYWPYLSADAANEVVTTLRGHKCEGETADKVNRWLDWLDAIGQRDWKSVSIQSTAVLRQFGQKQPRPAFAVREALLADYLSGGAEAVRERIKSLDGNLPADPSIRYLVALTGS